MNGELNKQNVERFLTYDRNGNLLTLIRYADGVQSSNRQYTYIGNRLDRMEKDKVIAWDEIEVHPGGPAIVVPEKVTEDNGTAALDAGISIDTSAIIRPVDPGIILHSRYAHDRNGNLTYDMELQTDFAYNSLNLLEKAMRNDTIVAKYSYLADGTKLSATTAVSRIEVLLHIVRMKVPNRIEYSRVRRSAAGGSWERSTMKPRFAIS